MEVMGKLRKGWFRADAPNDASNEAHVYRLA